VKRSPEYRSNRHLLACVTPSEVWQDDGAERTVFVLFQTRALSEEYVGFAVDSRRREVVTSAIVSLEIRGDKWLGHNEPLGLR
jgi:hypothetical protein